MDHKKLRNYTNYFKRTFSAMIYYQTSLIPAKTEITGNKLFPVDFEPYFRIISGKGRFSSFLDHGL